jgi:hypothetical protein
LPAAVARITIPASDREGLRVDPKIDSVIDIGRVAAAVPPNLLGIANASGARRCVLERVDSEPATAASG